MPAEVRVGHTGEPVTNLSLREGFEHVEVEERDEGSVVSTKTILQILMVDTNFGKELAAEL